MDFKRYGKTLKLYFRIWICSLTFSTYFIFYNLQILHSIPDIHHFQSVFPLLMVIAIFGYRHRLLHFLFSILSFIISSEILVIAKYFPMIFLIPQCFPTVLVKTFAFKLYKPFPDWSFFQMVEIKNQKHNDRYLKKSVSKSIVNVVIYCSSQFSALQEIF